MSVHVAALDSNAFTFFSDAMTRGYDAAVDDPLLAEQRLSVLRGYLYGGSAYTLLKAVVHEYRKIPDDEKRRQHDDIAATLMLDAVPAPPRRDVDRLTAQYLDHHPREPDCRILAEAEALGVPHLLTFDRSFLRSLSGIARVTQLVTPAAYFESLCVRPGARQKLSPTSGNALATLEWWRV